MPHIYSNRSKAATAVLVLLLAGLVLAACGGSSKSSSSASNASAASTATRGGGTGATGSRFLAIRECLQKNGITLPKPTSGQRPAPGSGAFLGGSTGPRLSQGATRAQYEAAIKKCGGGLGHLLGGGITRFINPTVKGELAKFALCMRANSVKLAEPNTSGKGPFFNTKGLNTASPKFRAAESKCRIDLPGAFRGGRPGAGGASGATGTAPPAAG